MIDVQVDEYGLDAKLANQLHIGGQVALDLLVTVPAGAGRKHLQLEAVPDFDVTAFSMRVCRLDVYEVSLILQSLTIGITDDLVIFFRLERTWLA